MLGILSWKFETDLFLGELQKRTVHVVTIGKINLNVEPLLCVCPLDNLGVSPSATYPS